MDYEEIIKYEKRWPIGTRERVMLDVYCYTGLRRGDAARVGKQHVRDGVISMQTEKTGTWVHSLLMNGTPTLANLAADNATTLQAQNALLRREMDASFDWDDLARLRDIWPRRLLVKGVCSPEDIARCFAIGADAVVISNHGGRQLDDAVSPLEILPQVRHLGPVLVDGGVRRGSDIVKAVALGAKAVLLGRSVLYGLAASGEAGASKALSILFEEIDRTLALIGCPAASRLDETFVAATALLPTTAQSRSNQPPGQ
jgi:(S)-mandelate dehydrogenase